MRVLCLTMLVLPQTSWADPGRLDVDEQLELGVDVPRFEVPMGIVNGEETNNFKPVVALGIDAGGFVDAYCSGTLVHPEWVVTAAHCVDGAATGQFAFGDPVVVFGAEVTSGAERLVPMAEWIPHPSWNGSLENGADIGLVRLAEPQDDWPLMVVNDEVPDASWLGTELQFVGFGITSDMGNDSGVKRTTRIPVTNVTPEYIESFSPETNVCSGDSGGASLEDTPDGFELAGVNSYVTPSCSGGANGASNVASYLDFILDYVPEIYTDHKQLDSLGGPGNGMAPQGPDGLNGLTPRWGELTGTGGVKGCASAPVSPSYWGLALVMLGLRRSGRR